MNEVVDKETLACLLENHFVSGLDKEAYDVQSVDPVEMLSSTRFDLAFKLLYLEKRQKTPSYARSVYDEHIRAFSLGSYTEPGNNTKKGSDGFISAFEETYSDIEKNGFDSRKTVIPLSLNGSLANGSHRVASALFLKKNISCVQLNENNHIYDYRFFYDRNINSGCLDAVATTFVEYASDIYLACVWPTANGSDRDIEKLIPNIVYRKEVTLNEKGAHNLLSQIYYDEKWIGSPENNYRGVLGKLVECFKSFDPVRIIAFQADNLEQVVDIKDKIRGLFNVGKHSVHITDTKEEAVRLARIVFNDNSVHFLNYAQPYSFSSTHHRITKVKACMQNNNIDFSDMVLDTGMVLSVYGLRKSQDIDYFINKHQSLRTAENLFECHNDELTFHEENAETLLYNPEYYFYFDDVKFVSFNQIYRMKKNRGEEKDRNDCKMMESLIEHNSLKYVMNRMKQRVFYGKVKVRALLISILKGLGLYNIVKSLFLRKNRADNER